MIKQSYAKDMILCNDAEFCREDEIGASIIYAYEDSDVFYPARLRCKAKATFRAKRNSHFG